MADGEQKWTHDPIYECLYIHLGSNSLKPSSLMIDFDVLCALALFAVLGVKHGSSLYSLTRSRNHHLA